MRFPSLSELQRRRVLAPATAAAAVALVFYASSLTGSASTTIDAKALSKALAASPLGEEQKILHVLNRLSFGPRPGDVDKVRKMGIAEYIRVQLNPDAIDDSALETRLQPLETTRMSSRELGEIFARAQQAQRRLQAQRNQAQQQTGDAAARADNAPARPPVDPEVRKEMEGQRKIGFELSQAKVLRATYSERQLQEVMTDFWFNHFNVFIGKGADRVLTTEYERDVIRANALGNFKDLLAATAKSPAMLFYLDNWMSIDPNARPPERAARGRGGRPGEQAVAAQLFNSPRRPRGLNENYARELMELHTLGVDGGYAQKDVTEVARCFTGWTLRNPRQGGGFQFVPFLHDNADKKVLGETIPAGGGMRDGERVLEMLASHPSTARFIATKLCRRFVADTPPEPLVARVAETFTRTGGDIRAMLQTIFTSKEFYSREAYRAKVKKPLELVASALRATGAETTVPPVILFSLRSMGEMLYGCQPPTGYADTADAWINTGALLERMNFATRLTSNMIPATRVRFDTASGDTAKMARALLGEAPARDFVKQIDGQLASAQAEAGEEKAVRIAGLVLGSPEFQKR